MTPIAVITLLLMSYSSSTLAQAGEPHHYELLGLGFVLGSALSLFIVWFLTRNHRTKFQDVVTQLNQEKQTIIDTEHAMANLVKEQEESQDRLEDRVQERTLELNIALQELESVNQELERKNVLDELTGLHNRRFYDQKILAEYRRSRRNLGPLSLIVIDIDHFKTVNDTHGHQAGDHCLTVLAHHLKNSLKRSADKAFRYGGEEFCLILPNTDGEGAFLFAEQLRKLISQEPVVFEETEIPLTISCGISTYLQQEDIGPEQMFSGADKALYEAKHSGRNQTKQYTFTE